MGKNLKFRENCDYKIIRGILRDGEFAEGRREVL